MIYAFWVGIYPRYHTVASIMAHFKKGYSLERSVMEKWKKN